MDEYGWRHFGDIYADHEAIFQPDRQPLVSHYNNQYDALLGFGYQFLRTGDSRWWSQMDQLAVHVADIDIYHSDGDKAAYNHGLFWHTFHYVDAGMATHRTYPGVPAVPGGGPANEHNYSTGLMLHYFLTGDPLSREAVLDLAGWVLAMDDGSKSIFRWLAKGDTGLASSTASAEYHGPGRGAGHSISTLLNAHRLTGERLFLDKAEQLIARCIHPSDDIASRGLLDIETRWSYTVFLQVLGKYLDYSAERGDGGGMYAYARESLLHYARWMAAHERPYLEARADREHQVETWAAQDMRKSEAFWFAALHASGPEREQFRERAEFFFRASTSTLLRVPTRTFARAVVIMLSTGFMRAYFHRHPEAQAVPPRPGRDDFGLPQTFIPQKARAKRRLIALAGTMGALGLLSALYLAI